MCGHLWLREQVFIPPLSTSLLSGPGDHLMSFFSQLGLGVGPSRASVLPHTLSSSGCYSLSVRLSRPTSWDRIRHYRIHRLDNGWLYISPRLTFPSLQALVDHYSGMAISCFHETGTWGVGGRQLYSWTLHLLENIQTGRRGTSPSPYQCAKNVGQDLGLHPMPRQSHKVLPRKHGPVPHLHCGSESKTSMVGTVLSTGTRPRAVAVVQFS